MEEMRNQTSLTMSDLRWDSWNSENNTLSHHTCTFNPSAFSCSKYINNHKASKKTSENLLPLGYGTVMCKWVFCVTFCYQQFSTVCQGNGKQYFQRFLTHWIRCHKENWMPKAFRLQSQHASIRTQVDREIQFHSKGPFGYNVQIV